MPKVTIHEDCYALTSKEEVGTTNQFLASPPTNNSPRPEERDHSQFGRTIATTTD